MSSSALSTLLQTLIAVVNQLVAIILAPISAIITALLPGVDGLFSNVSAWLIYATTYVGWVIDALGIPPVVISIIVSFYTFKLMSSFAVWGIKIALKWWEALKP